MDDLDRRILVKLQEDGSLTNARLAEAIGLSQSAMSERVRRLQQEGHILGYRTLLDPASVGLHLQAFVATGLVRHGTDSIEAFETGIVAIPGVDKAETMLVYSEVKPDTGWPVPAEFQDMTETTHQEARR